VKARRFGVRIGVSVLLLTTALFAQPGDPPRLPREQWGAPLVTVSHEGNQWIIAGQKNKVTFSQSDLSMTVQAGPVSWAMVASSDDDMLLKSRGEEFYVRLADASKIDIKPFDTG